MKMSLEFLIFRIFLIKANKNYNTISGLGSKLQCLLLLPILMKYLDNIASTSISSSYLEVKHLRLSNNISAKPLPQFF